MLSAEGHRFFGDYMVGLLSVAVLGIAGLLMNVLIARYYGAAVLGVFNQVFAIYILGAQFAAFGIQFSVLRYVAEHGEDRQTLETVVRSGLLMVAVIALAVALAIFGSRNAIGAALSSNVADGVVYALPGLWAFAVNKYLLNTLNGMRRMKTYSLFLSYRFALLLLGVIVAAVVGVAGNTLPVIFTLAEITLLFSLLAYMRALVLGRIALDAMRAWGRSHFYFGLKSVTGGAVSELNTRVDVLVLGLFTEDRVVGIFSFAAILAEGLLQIPLIIKRQADPILTPLVLQADHHKLLASFRSWRRWSYIVMGLVCVGGVLLFPWFTQWATKDGELQSGWLIFTLLLVAGTVQSGYIPLSGLLGQGGFPWQQTLYLILLFGSNIALNLLLVPPFGALGAAISTSIVYVASIFYLKYLVQRFMGIRV